MPIVCVHMIRSAHGQWDEGKGVANLSQQAKGQSWWKLSKNIASGLKFGSVSKVQSS